jgi:hypothetical protein
VGIIADLKLRHLIPPERLTLDYLSRLVEGIHFSSTLLDAERGISVSQRGWGRRILDSLRRMKLALPDRWIQSSATRGFDRAARLLSK